MLFSSYLLVSKLKQIGRLFFVIGFLYIGLSGNAAAQSGCDTINFTVGTKWSLCWELRQREGLVVSFADYTDKGGVTRRVLYRGSVAEVHVPYHPGSPRFLDITVDTQGLGFWALNLAATECDGVLLNPKVCREVHNYGHAWKMGQFFQLGQEVVYWTSSQLGQYNYLIGWTFRDTGAIESEASLTGRLQILRSGTAYAGFGSRVNSESSFNSLYGINHMHNLYLRLDFNIAGSSDDAVNRITRSTYVGSSPDAGVSCLPAGTCQTNQHTRLAAELVERLTSFKSWHQIDRGTLNLDGRPVGYELISKGNQLWTGPSSEPWAAGEVYVTRYNGCELFAVNNNNPSLNPGCSSAAPHIQAMVNSEPVDGADVVLWYNAHFRHVVRDEDQVNMLAEHMGLEIEPRSWRHVSTLE